MLDKQIEEFQKKYPAKADKEAALKKMSNAQIEALIKASTNTYQKIFFSKFKKK